MSWDRGFISALSQSSIALEFLLEFVNITNHLGQNYRIRVGGNVRFSGVRVVPQRWNVSFGGFSCDLAGEIQPMLPYIRKGQLAVLFCRVINQTDFERIAIGQLDTLNGFRGRFTLVFRDFLSALQNSFDTRSGALFSSADPARFNLFYEVGQTAVVGTTSFGITDTTINLNNTSFFKKHSGTASIPSRGVAKIEPISGDDPFYIFWTGKTSTQLTGISTMSNRGGSRSVAATNSICRYVAFAENQPWDIIGSIITSTGSASNGPLDIFPQEWSCGGFISRDLFDFADASKQASYIKRSDNGVYEWGIVIETPLNNGIRSIVDIGSLSGQWPVYRQGKISWRGCSDPYQIDSEIMMGAPQAQLFDNDIIQILDHQFYNPDIPNIYRTTLITYSQAGNATFSGGGSDRVQSLPAIYNIQRDNTLYYLHDRSGVDKSGEMALGDLRRMRRWDLYVSERLVLQVPLKFSGLVAGDIVEITSRYLYGLLEPQNRTFNAKRAMVTACDFDFDNQNCVLTLCLAGRKSYPKPDQEIL